MIETLLGVALVAFAFMAVGFVRIRAGCAADCGACERPCVSPGPDPLPESNHGMDEKH